MAQQLLDLGERAARAQRLHGGEMPQPVRVDHPEADTLCGGRHDLCYPRGAEGGMGRHEPDEDGPALRARWTAIAQIGGDGGADISGDRQTLSSGSLAVHDDLAETPIDIIKLESGDFGRAQSEPGKQRQDREIPASSCARRQLLLPLDDNYFCRRRASEGVQPRPD